ncbi:13688_t:CDS:1, partial [Dentiscutata erythropus]
QQASCDKNKDKKQEKTKPNDLSVKADPNDKVQKKASTKES